MWNVVRADGAVIVHCATLAAALAAVVDPLTLEERARVVVAGALFAARVQRVRLLLDGRELATCYAPPAARRAA